MHLFIPSVNLLYLFIGAKDSKAEHTRLFFLD
jgi:hypothetical protein